MKARRLIEKNGKYNIVYFGSSGKKLKNKTIRNLKEQSVTYLYPYFNKIGNTKLNFKLELETDEPALSIKIKFKYFENENWIDEEKEYDIDLTLNERTNRYEGRCDISEIYDNYNMPRSFTLTIDYANPDNVTLNYLENAGDLTYDVEEQNKQRNAPNYKEVVSVGYSYSSKQEGVRDSLIPRLGIIKGELWYRKSYGLPLLDKIKSKGIFDSIIVGYIMDHPDVVGLIEFTSKLDGHSYKYDCKINTIYNEEVELFNKL